MSVIILQQLISRRSQPDNLQELPQTPLLKAGACVSHCWCFYFLPTDPPGEAFGGSSLLVQGVQSLGVFQESLLRFDFPHKVQTLLPEGFNTFLYSEIPSFSSHPSTLNNCTISNFLQPFPCIPSPSPPSASAFPSAAAVLFSALPELESDK